MGQKGVESAEKCEKCEKCDFNENMPKSITISLRGAMCQNHVFFAKFSKTFFAKIALSQNLTISYRKSMILGAISALFALLRKSAKSRTFLAQVEK